MNLKKKKQLAIRTLGIGNKRITFVKERIAEIKEAITKQDIRDLKESGAIVIKEIKGKRKIEKRKNARGTGKIKKKVKTRKKDYMTMTRKLRAYLKHLKLNGEVSREDYLNMRKLIRNKKFTSLTNLKAYIGGLKKWEYQKNEESNEKQIIQRD